MSIGETQLLNARPKWNATFHATLRSSGTVTVTGNTGIIAVPGVTSGDEAVFPLFFVAVGTDQAGDETNDLTIDWYGDSGGIGGILATITFAQLTAGSPTDIETWPGDITAIYANAGRDLLPLLPYHRITHTLAGTTISMSYIIYMSSLSMGV